jgi:hypothetical protein
MFLSKYSTQSIADKIITITHRGTKPIAMDSATGILLKQWGYKLYIIILQATKSAEL